MRPWQFLTYDKLTSELLDDIRLPLSDEEVGALLAQLGLSSEVTAFSVKVTPADVPIVSKLVDRSLDLETRSYVLEAWMFPPGPDVPPGQRWVWRGRRAPGSDYWGVWWHPHTGETMHPHFANLEFQIRGARAVSKIGEATCYEIAGGINWIRESLEAGGRMSRTTLRLIDPSVGAVYTCVADKGPISDLELAHGFASRSEAIASATGAIELVLGAEASLLLAENSVAHPGEPAAIASIGTTLIATDIVVAAQLLRGQSAEGVGDFLFGVPSGYPTNAIATRSAPSFAQLQEVTDAELEDLVRGTCAVIVRAFDNESLIVWLAERIRP
jgi:hypothetical protein